MKQLKKTLLTLVALLAVTTGAWAEEKSETISTNTSQEEYTGEHFKITPNIKPDGLTVADLRNYADGQVYFSVQTLDGQNISKLDLQINYIDDTSIDNLSLSSGTKSYDSNTHVLTITNVNADHVQISLTEEDEFGIVKISSVTYYYEESGTTVNFTRGTGDKADEWTMDGGMPAGNVTVSVDYFPKATADGAVTAATDAKATTDAPLVTVDATMLTGAAKMMYYVSTEATAPAYDAEGWTDVLPTAANYTEAGNVNVWYYPVGTDEGVDGATATYSDGDMNATALAVTLGDAPTYSVTFADGVNPEPPAEPEWTASPNADVKKGQTVTVTYSGAKKVLGMKVEKKKVLVTSITLNQTGNITRTYGDSGTLSVTSVLPEDATDKTYTWSSNDPYGVSIDQNGNWRVVGRSGFVNLRATANDGSGVYAQITVFVR